MTAILFTVPLGTYFQRHFRPNSDQSEHLFGYLFGNLWHGGSESTFFFTSSSKNGFRILLLFIGLLLATLFVTFASFWSPRTPSGPSLGSPVASPGPLLIPKCLLLVPVLLPNPSACLFACWFMFDCLLV